MISGLILNNISFFLRVDPLYYYDKENVQMVSHFLQADFIHEYNHTYSCLYLM